MNTSENFEMQMGLIEQQISRSVGIRQQEQQSLSELVKHLGVLTDRLLPLIELPSQTAQLETRMYHLHQRMNRLESEVTVLAEELQPLPEGLHHSLNQFLTQLK